MLMYSVRFRGERQLVFLDPAPETLRGWNTRWEMISVAVFLVGDGLSIGSEG